MAHTKTQSLPSSLWKFYLRYAFRGNWWSVIGWALCWLIASFDNVLFPFYQKWLVASLESPIPTDVTWLEYILPTILLIIGLDIMMFVFVLLRSVFSFRWAPNANKQMSVVLTNYTQSQSMSWWTSRMPGKVNQQMIYIRNLDSIMENLWWCTCTFLMICINSGMLFRINLYVAIMFLCAFAFRVIFAWGMRKKIKNASEERANANSTLSGKLVDSLSNYAIVKSFSGARREEKYLEPHRNKKVKTSRSFGFLNRIFWGVPGTLWSVFFGGTLFFCSMLYYRGEMTIADIVFTIGVFFSVMGSINVLINRIPDIIDKISSASKSYRELVGTIDVTDIDNAPDLLVDRGAIEFKNISFKYRRSRKYVLRDFNLKIRPGERVGIVGLSGAGKTTLVNLLMRFYDPNSGAVFIDGQDVAKVSQDSLRENISYIPQEPTMFNRTIAENIEYGRPGASLHEIKAAAVEASADEFIRGTDKKYNSLVGDRGIKLSGGQRQRIAIARAFLKNAPILILDEATSALDSETEIAIQKSFDKLSSGHTTLVVAHRLSTLRNMDRIIVLDQGRVIESGTHNALLRRRGLYAKLWKMQSGGFLQ